MMADGSIVFRDGKLFAPWDQVHGKVTGREPSGEVRLFWKTCGRGTEEVRVVDSQTIDGSGDFELALPGAPFSVNGVLVGIAWFVEWVDRKGRGICVEQIIMAPDGMVIELEKVEEDQSTKYKKAFFSIGKS